MRLTRLCHALPLAAAAIFLCAAPAAAQDAADRTIVPGQRVGAITRTSTKDQIVKVYGAKNVRDHRVGVGEGETEPGLVLFPGTRDELFLIWKVKDREVDHFRILRAGSPWKTADGIGMGTTAETLAKLNGGPFSITGFGWDYGGRVVDWRGGKLPKQLVLDMEATRKVSPAYEKSVLGDGIFPSNNPVMLQKKLVVRGIIVGLEE